VDYASGVCGCGFGGGFRLQETHAAHWKDKFASIKMRAIQLLCFSAFLGVGRLLPFLSGLLVRHPNNLALFVARNFVFKQRCFIHAALSFLSKWDGSLFKTFST